MKLDFEEINRAALANFDTVVARFVPGGTRQGAEYVTRNPTRADSNPGSFKINCNSAVWCDFATGEKGKDLISLIAYVEPCKQGEAAHHLAVFLGIETPTTNKRTATAPAPRVVETFIFHNADGSEAYRKDRYEPGFNPGESKGFAFYRMINGKREKGGGGIHLPYRLHAVLAAETVLFFEGEAKADIVYKWGYCGTSLDTGAKSKLTPEMVEQFTGRHVVIVPDNDAPGKEYGAYLARTLHGKAASVKVVDLPGLGAKGDIKDWIKITGNDAARLRAIIEAAAEWHPTEPAATAAGKTPESEKPVKKPGGKRAEANELLLSLAMDFPLYKDNSGDIYTAYKDRMMRVETAEHILTYQFYQHTGSYPSAESIKGVLRLLVAKGREEAELIEMYTRVGTHEGAIVVDLLQGRCAKITRDGVTTTAPPPIFLSFPHQQAHPDPDLNGDPWHFLDFCNVAKEQRLVVLVALIASFVPGIANPLLMVHGPPGSAKSTFCLFFKKVCDPSSVELQGLNDNDMKDFYAMAREQWIIPDSVTVNAVISF